MTELAKKRPEFRNINAFKDLTTYRMTPAAWVSILHRASGAILFLLGIIWGYLHHMIAGMRHLWMDISHEAVNKQFGKTSALFTLVVSISLTLVLGAKLFGLY